MIIMLHYVSGKLKKDFIYDFVWIDKIKLIIILERYPLLVAIFKGNVQ